MAARIVLTPEQRKEEDRIRTAPSQTLTKEERHYRRVLRQRRRDDKKTMSSAAWRERWMSEAEIVREEMGDAIWDAPLRYPNGRKMSDDVRYRYHEITFLLKFGLRVEQVAEKLGLSRAVLVGLILDTEHPLGSKVVADEYETAMQAPRPVLDPNRHGLYEADAA